MDAWSAWRDDRYACRFWAFAGVPVIFVMPQRGSESDEIVEGGFCAKVLVRVEVCPSLALDGKSSVGEDELGTSL